MKDACSLNSSDQEKRFGEFAALASVGLIGAVRIPHGAVLRLRNTASVREALWPLIEAERRCCSFLSFDVRVRDGDLVVEVSGPPGARTLIDRLFDLEPAAGAA